MTVKCNQLMDFTSTGAVVRNYADLIVLERGLLPFRWTTSDPSRPT
ncbi:MAG: hypothetical protein U0703_29080 [Anaerolineae bacterium]